MGLALCLAVAWNNGTSASAATPAGDASAPASADGSRRGTPTCSSSSYDVLCRYEGRCICQYPGCECAVEWTDLAFGHIMASEVQIDVNISCASLSRPGAFISSVAVTANQQPYEVQVLDNPVMGASVATCHPSDQYHPPRRVDMCERSFRLVPSRRLPSLEGVALTSLQVRVGPGAAHCREALQGPNGDPWACERESGSALRAGASASSIAIACGAVRTRAHRHVRRAPAARDRCFLTSSRRAQARATAWMPPHPTSTLK